MPPIDLKDKPICITGASSGIGAATALACARAGMPVLLAARREDKLAEIVERIRSEGGEAAAEVVDVADAEACERMIARAIEQFGSIYSVFANAGYGLEKAVHEMSDEEMRRIFEVNYFGTLNTLRPATPHMLERGAGHLLICSSCLARFPIPYYSAYSATKAAQHHIGRAMRLELEPHGVHVSTVHPVGTKTEFFDQVKGHSRRTTLVEHSPDFFMQTPERVARAVVRCLRRPRPEVWTSKLTLWGMAFGAATPRIADMGVRHMVRKRQAELERRGRERSAKPAGAETEKAPG
ncbi:MAG: SDR family NAD(P)-dependent oxidoreductase [Phycisphaeraceae bacterium]|nr:MAG: SDR family NAD(P)-dependent oxidoreductase [Phycisphaeraceae bacterium]